MTIFINSTIVNSSTKQTNGKTEMNLFTNVELSTLDVCSHAVEDLINLDLFLAAEKMQSVIDRILKNAVRRNVEFPKFLRVQAI